MLRGPRRRTPAAEDGRPPARRRQGAPRAGVQARARGHHRQARRQTLPRRTRARLGEGEVPQAPGDGDHRRHVSRERAPASARSCSRCATETPIATRARSARASRRRRSPSLPCGREDRGRVATGRGRAAHRGRAMGPARSCAQGRFTEWTRDGVLRHPTFEGLREDEFPAKVVREGRARADPTSRGQRRRRASSARRIRCRAASGCTPRGRHRRRSTSSPGCSPHRSGRGMRTCRTARCTCASCRKSRSGREAPSDRARPCGRRPEPRRAGPAAGSRALLRVAASAAGTPAAGTTLLRVACCGWP